MEFKFTQHKGTDVHLVRMAEEDFEALEDNQVLVQVTDLHAVACTHSSNRLTSGKRLTVGMIHPQNAYTSKIDTAPWIYALHSAKTCGESSLAESFLMV